MAGERSLQSMLGQMSPAELDRFRQMYMHQKAAVRPSPPAPREGVFMGGIPRREPYPSEMDYFRANPHVSGMAAEDNAVILNPQSNLSAAEREAVALNESARVMMRRPEWTPDFALTPEQERAFATYGPPEAQRATVGARLLSGDPSGLAGTPEQMEFVRRLRQKMMGY